MGHHANSAENLSEHLKQSSVGHACILDLNTNPCFRVKTDVSLSTRAFAALLLRSVMPQRVLWMTSLLLFLGLAKAQTPAPTTTYKIHAQKERSSSNLPSTLIHLLPDQNLLILIPQQGSGWTLKRIGAWSTDNPKEETLSFTGNPLAEGESGLEDLIVNPAGTYAVIRIRSFGGNLYDGTVRNRTALVVLVELQGFTVVTRRITADPLFASSEWSFAKNGLLITAALVQRSSVPAQLKHPWEYTSITDAYQAAALTLPSLAPSMMCRYERMIYPAGATSQSTSHVVKGSEECSSLVIAADVQTVENLPGGQFPSLRYADLGRPCQFAAEDPSGKFGLYGCRTGNGYLDDMIVTTKTRDFAVLSLPDGKRVLTVPLPHNTKPVPALLATAGDHTWLVVLRNGVELSTYRIP